MREGDTQRVCVELAALSAYIPRMISMFYTHKERKREKMRERERERKK